jgi:hypothetical protein
MSNPDCACSQLFYAGAVNLLTMTSSPCLAWRVIWVLGLTFVTLAKADPAPTTAVIVPTPGLTLQKDFPAVKLRGYGTLAGKFWVDGSGGSLLEIDCADAEHARLVQAKYLSDLSELPPATASGEITVGGAKISIQTAPDVGAVAALRNGTTVVIAAAKTPEALGTLITGGITGSKSAWTSQAEGKVPMFLDRFDKYGFRFYYAPGRLKPGPDGKHEDPTYDPRSDFDYAQASNHAGLQIWQGGQPGETAEGMTKDPVWDWSLAEAQKRGLPFGINFGIDEDVYWYYNRHPESLMKFAPGFLGSYYGSFNFGIGPMVAWTSTEGIDVLMAQLQSTVNRYKNVDNITSWMEPHEEVGHGAADYLTDTGPGAGQNYRKFLLDKYKTIQVVSQRWYGDTTTLTSWNGVHVPEPADFLGWGPEAIDLAGTWRVNYDSVDKPEVIAPGFDDSGWPLIVGPGHGVGRLYPKAPALWRRHLALTDEWLKKHPSVWLYVWDMNDTREGRENLNSTQKVIATLNGNVLPEKPAVYNQDHWAAYDVSLLVHPADNVVTVKMPRGMPNYRIYLSGDEPKSYPAMGEGKNARWVDFIDWQSYIRVNAVRRGMQMIRQTDPGRGILLASPDSFVDGLLEDAIDYGGDFHNTGYMAGWWCDALPSYMRAAGLPMSAEPGGPATKGIDLRFFFENWICEGTNAVDYFLNLGDVLWNPDCKQMFDSHLPMYTSVGKYHVPPAQIAGLFSVRVQNLFGFPFEEHPAMANGHPIYNGSGFVSGANCRKLFSPVEHMPKGTPYESDEVTELMFEHDQVGKYKVIIDSGTCVMDEATLAGIERFVRNGGVFVTWGDTGRHSPEKPDSWPIDRLSGFRLAAQQPGSGMLSVDPKQPLISSDFVPPANAKGGRLEPLTPDAHNLLAWADGSAAMGIRQIGKGYIIRTAVGFDGATDNIFFSHLFQALHIDPIPATYQAGGGEVYWRHFVSNNGLYDVWTVVNYDRDQANTGTLTLADGIRPAWYVDLDTGKRSTMADGKLPISLPPREMGIYITPRAAIAGTTADWFNLQRSWWKGTVDTGAPFPKPDPKLAIDLTDSWSFQPVDTKQTDVSALIAATTDDKTWKQRNLGIFTLPDYPDMRHMVLRKHFHVPEAWNHGRVILHLPEWRGHAQGWIDGQPGSQPYTLAAGSNHVLAVELQGTEMLLGARGGAWLSYHPEPTKTQDLAGKWQTSTDAIHWDKEATLPGTVERNTHLLRANVEVDAAARGKTVVLHATEASMELKGAIINGQYVRPWVTEGPELNINVTPWIVPGSKNELMLIMGGSHETISAVTLEFHTPGTYP